MSTCRNDDYLCTTISHTFLTEVVLSVLLEVFQFSLPDKEIHWEMISISAPIVKDAGDKLHRMPLKVSLVPKMAASVS